MGGGFGVPCGTCRTKQYGVNYVGTAEDITVEEMGAYDSASGRNTPDFNLSEYTVFTDSKGSAINCFDRIKDLAKKQMENTKLSDADKKKQVQELAAEIAEKFSKKTFELLNGDLEMKDHFTKSFMTSDHDIIVYDYRDDTALSSEHAVDTAVRTWAWAKMTYPAQYLQPGTGGTILFSGIEAGRYRQ